MTPHITFAATKFDGVTYLGKNHAETIHLHAQTTGQRGSGEQGFLTSEGVFVDREQALVIALVADQIEMSQFSKTELYSEDLL